MKSIRELQFLTYLDALEKGDAEGISAFLALAEVDAELEKMMMDYHQEEQAESPQEKSKVITPFKRKREDVNRWWGRFGTGLVAAIMMVMVGTAGIFIGATGFNPVSSGADAVDLANGENGAPQDLVCQAEITSEENQIMLVKDGDIERSMTVGVNNPFIIIPSSGRASSGYSAIFEGLRVTVAKNSVSIPEGCERLSSITVYPKDNPDRTCSITTGTLYFPIEQYTFDMVGTGHIPLYERLVLLDAPVDGGYPIHNLLFSGNIPTEFVEVTGECTSYPLLYVQATDNMLPPNPAEETFPRIEVETMRVWEQHFERGAMFYLEQMEVIWIACDAGEEAGVSWLSMNSQMPIDVFSQGTGNPPDGLYPPQSRFIAPWQFVSMSDPDTTPICDLGWATSPSEMNQNATYRYENGVHSITALEGDIYSFHANPETGESFWRVNEN